jgi:hypothetical protein
VPPNGGITLSLLVSQVIGLTSFKSLLNLACYFCEWNSSISKKELFRTWQKIVESLANLESSWNRTFFDLLGHIRKILNQGSKITIESGQTLEGFHIRISGRSRIKSYCGRQSVKYSQFT